VCADSYFASVGAVEELMQSKMRFIGVIKTATRKFPMAYLSGLRLHQRGDRVGILHKDDNGIPDMIAFVWMDRERRYFIASGSSLQDGVPYVRSRWRQVDLQDDASPSRLELTVPQPRAAEVYYSCCGKIDQHNRDRQATLGIEKKLKTLDWSLRVNLSLLGIIVVDTWRIWQLFSSPETSGESVETQKAFYGQLAAELIDNNYDRIGGAARNRTTPTSMENDEDEPRYQTPRSGVDAHLTPTKMRINDKNNKGTHSRQGRCRVCKLKTTYQCSLCRDDPDTKDHGWLCHTKNGKTCFPQHLEEKHGL
jgi:Transposase IS4